MKKNIAIAFLAATSVVAWGWKSVRADTPQRLQLQTSYDTNWTVVQAICGTGSGTMIYVASIRGREGVGVTSVANSCAKASAEK